MSDSGSNEIENQTQHEAAVRQQFWQQLTQEQRRRLVQCFVEEMERLGPVVKQDCGCYRGTCIHCKRPMAMVFDPKTGRYQCDGGPHRVSLN